MNGAWFDRALEWYQRHAVLVDAFDRLHEPRIGPSGRRSEQRCHMPVEADGQDTRQKCIGLDERRLVNDDDIGNETTTVLWAGTTEVSTYSIRKLTRDGIGAISSTFRTFNRPQSFR